MFGFQRLDVYRCAVRFLATSGALASRIPSGHGGLRDQLRRAAFSISLNIAEGSGRGMGQNRDARRFYSIARGSALECAAVLDALEALSLVATEEVLVPKELLERIVSMLTKLVAAGG